MDRNAISCSFLLFLSMIISLSSSARINPFIDSTVADNIIDIIDDDHHGNNINDIIIDPHHSSSSIQSQSQQKSSGSNVVDDNSNIKPETATATATLIQSSAKEEEEEEEVPTVSLEKPTNNPPLPRRPFTVFRIQPNNNNRRPFLPLSYRRRRPVHRCHHHYNKPWNNNNRRGVDITNMINNLDDEFELLDNNINKDYFDRVLARPRGGKISLIGHHHVNQPMFLRRHQPRSNNMAREKKSTDDLLLRRLYHRRYHQRPHQDAPSVLPDQQIKDTTATAHGFVKSIRKFLNPF